MHPSTTIKKKIPPKQKKQLIFSLPDPHRRKSHGWVGFPDVFALTSTEYMFFKKCSWTRVSHAYNLSYTGGRNQEDLGLKKHRQIVLKILS
jgi:hypothetical protein